MGQAVSTPCPTEEADEDVSKETLISVEDVIKQRGSIAISSRYTTTRTLDSDYHYDQKTVGSGMSGPVQLATGKLDNIKYAVKTFKKKGLSVKKRKELKSEVEIYLSLDHPHIARLEMVYESEDELDLVMEYMAGGELYDRLSAAKHYTEALAADTTHQMLLAVAYLHANRVAHRDLKLENFLYEKKETNHLKLIDFGFAKFWDRSHKMTQACGSVHYVAPEVLKKSYTEKADIWSLGVIVFMLLTGNPPFGGSEQVVLQKIKAGKIHWSSRFQALSEQARDFVKQLLVVEPESRLSAQQALDHPWIHNRASHHETMIDGSILGSLRNFAHASNFRRAVFSMMAWSLSTEDRTEIREQFLALDTENKGTITHKQMKQVLEETFHIDCREAEELFHSLDTNNDDEIEYSEFLAAAVLGRVKVHEDVLRRTFHHFDQHETGQITASDLKDILGDHFNGVQLNDMIREADRVGNGMVNYEEFLEYFQKVDPEMMYPEELHSSDLQQRKITQQDHIERLGRVIDNLIPRHEDASPKTTPKPLNRRKYAATA